MTDSDAARSRGSRSPGSQSSGADPADVFEHRLRVRYCETDRMGVAHHGSYVDWIEEARTEWMRSRGMTYRELEDSGVLLQVIDVRIRYRKSVTYDDEVVIETFLAERRRVSLTIGYRVRSGLDGALVAEASTELACVDAATGKVGRLPDSV